MKNWLYRQWMRFRVWLTAMLAAMGLIVAASLYAETVTFTYTRATSYDNGVPMPLTEIQFTRLYCDGALANEEPGADEDITADLGVGSHDCYATHVDIYDRESLPSNTVTRVVSPPGTGPSPPVLTP